MADDGMPSSFDSYSSDYKEEGRWEKLWRKIKEEPLIPFGCVLTSYALYRASRSMKKGDHHQTNRMFRARIYAQFFTICCMVGGSYYYADERAKRKVFETAIAEQKTMTKRELWIKELEARDQEEKEQEEREKQMKKKAKSVPKIQTPVSSPLEESEMRRLGVLAAVKSLGGWR